MADVVIAGNGFPCYRVIPTSHRARAAIPAVVLYVDRRYINSVLEGFLREGFELEGEPTPSIEERLPNVPGMTLEQLEGHCL